MAVVRNEGISYETKHGGKNGVEKRDATHCTCSKLVLP
jgi:hypothetical protein